MTEYTRHRFSDWFPISGLDDLTADIEKHGQQDPILIFDGQILDGWHRYLACQRLGIEPKTTTFEGTLEDAWEIVKSRNVKRRDLTPLDRARVALRRAEATKGGQPGNQNASKQSPNEGLLITLRSGLPRVTRQQACDSVGASLGMLRKLRTLENSKDDKLIAQVNKREEIKKREAIKKFDPSKHGVDFYDAYSIATEPKGIREEALKRVMDPKLKSVTKLKSAAKTIKREREAERIKAEKAEREAAEREKREAARKAKAERDRKEREAKEARDAAKKAEKAEAQRLKEAADRKQREAEEAAQAAEEADQEAEEASVPDPVIHCSCKEMIEHVDAGTVDCIFTDPPYPKEYLHCWPELASFAVHALRPGGTLIALTPHQLMPYIIDRLNVDGLTYRWCLAYVYQRCGMKVHSARVSVGWKPALVFRRDGGSTLMRYRNDMIQAGPYESDQTSKHHWGQTQYGMDAIAKEWLQPGWKVCDPFVGAGSLLMAARKIGCTITGCDIDLVHVETSNRQLKAE